MGDNVLEHIHWTDDCQGKKDFDGPILSLSTRYWPRGGGFHSSFIRPGEPAVWEGNETRPEIKPSAKASIVLFGQDLKHKEFEAETEEEVKAQVEIWARQELERLRDHIKLFYRPRDSDEPLTGSEAFFLHRAYDQAVARVCQLEQKNREDGWVRIEELEWAKNLVKSFENTEKHMRERRSYDSEASRYDRERIADVYKDVAAEIRLGAGLPKR